MRIEYLREFVMAASCLNFTVAAKKLYMTQPKMSAHIASMESELGFSLFDREGGLTLTHEGKRFFEGVSSFVEEYDRLVQECASSAGLPTCRLVLGEFSLFEMFPPSSLNLYSKALDVLCERHPSLDVDAVPIGNGQLIADLLYEGACDVSFRSCCFEGVPDEVVDLEDGMSVLPLEMDDMVVWMREGHPLARLDEVAVDELAVYPILLSSCPSMRTWNTTRQDFMAAHGLKATFKLKNAPTPSLFVAPTKGDEVYLIASTFSRTSRVRTAEGMTIRPLGPTKANSCFCLCFSQGSANPAVHELVSIMKEARTA